MGRCICNWDDEKDNLKNYLIDGLNYEQIAEKYGMKCGNRIKEYVKKFGLIDLYNPIFKCKYCGKEFKSKHEYAGHISSCEKSPKYKDKLEQLSRARKCISTHYTQASEELVCKYCGKICHNKGALKIHEGACDMNPDRKKHPNRKGNGGTNAGHTAWNKGKNMCNDERILKYAQTRRKNLEDGKFIVVGTPHTPETKARLRKKMIEYIEKTIDGGFQQHYSQKGCEYIDELNEKMGWNLIHAKNGGEKEVCGYFLDGYDAERNIAFEYDEPYHYADVYNNILKEKDIERQNEIIRELNCEFYRYNEKINKLYKI